MRQSAPYCSSKVALAHYSPRLLAGAGPTTVSVAGGNVVLTVTNTTPNSRGEARLSWDGDSNPNALTPNGLGGVNLSTGNSSGFRLRFAIPPERAQRLALGAQVEVEVETFPALLSATVRQVSPALDPASGMIIAEAELVADAATTAQLRPGLAAWVKE